MGKIIEALRDRYRCQSCGATLIDMRWKQTRARSTICVKCFLGNIPLKPFGVAQWIESSSDSRDFSSPLK